MLKYIVVFLLSFFLTALTAYGSEDSDRTRRVKVALALEATPTPIVETAPEPKVKPWPNYVEGYEKAFTESKVLVVYIGCEGSHPINEIPGAVVAVQTTLAPYSKGTILVAYPFGKELVTHKTLKCEEFATVAKETENAVKKKSNATTTDSPISKPLNWDMTSNCYCGENCKCKDKSKCPNSCPVLNKCDNCDKCDCEKCDGKCGKVAPVVTPPVIAPPVVTQPQLYLFRDANGNYYYSSCPDGRCKVK